MIRIFTGPIRTGKTTRLRRYCDELTGIGGYLTPDHQGLRCLYDIERQEMQTFESIDQLENVIKIGRFSFHKSAFDSAEKRMKLQASDPSIHTIVIDEIGKLEMKHEGFYLALCELLQSEIALIVVVRDYLLDDFMAMLRDLDYQGDIDIIHAESGRNPFLSDTT